MPGAASPCLPAPAHAPAPASATPQDVRAPVFKALLHFAYTDSLPDELQVGRCGGLGWGWGGRAGRSPAGVAAERGEILGLAAARLQLQSRWGAAC